MLLKTHVYRERHARAMGLSLPLSVCSTHHTVETNQEQKQSWGQRWLSGTCFPKEGPLRPIFIATPTLPTLTKNVIRWKAKADTMELLSSIRPYSQPGLSSETLKSSCASECIHGQGCSGMSSARMHLFLKEKKCTFLH